MAGGLRRSCVIESQPIFSTAPESTRARRTGPHPLATISSEKATVSRAFLTTDLPIALSVLPILYLIRMCLRLHVDVPFGDQWELVPRLVHLNAGALSLTDLWGQHNEHRPMFPVVMMLALARATGWNINAEIVTNVLLGTGIFLVAAAAMQGIYRELPAWRWWLLPVCALLLFSPEQWENWLWGWQIQIFLGVLAGLAGLFLLSLPRQSAVRFGLALCCGVVGTYSFASGLTYWVVGPVALGLHPAHRGWRKAVAWVIVGGATIASYFADYHLNPGHPSMLAGFRSVAAFKDLLLYIAKYVGAPVASLSVPAAVFAGALGIIAFFVLLAARWRDRRRPAFIFACAVGLNALAGAGMTGLGRVGYGTDQAMASRYGTIAAPLWLALLFLGLMAACGSAGALSGRRVRAALLAAAALVLSLSIMQSGQAALTAATARTAFLRSLRPNLAGAQDWAAISRLYVNNVPLTQERVRQMQALHISVFRDRP